MCEIGVITLLYFRTWDLHLLRKQLRKLQIFMVVYLDTMSSKPVLSKLRYVRADIKGYARWVQLSPEPVPKEWAHGALLMDSRRRSMGTQTPVRIGSKSGALIVTLLALSR